MTVDEVVWFANHKYGECAYEVKSKTELRIFTSKSQWIIFLRDMPRFGKYTLYHINHMTDKEHFHRQCYGYHLDFLVYYAIRHDLDLPCDMNEFMRLYEMWKLGREVEESIAAWEFFCKD